MTWGETEARGVSALTPAALNGEPRVRICPTALLE